MKCWSRPILPDKADSIVKLEPVLMLQILTFFLAGDAFTKESMETANLLENISFSMVQLHV